MAFIPSLLLLGLAYFGTTAPTTVSAEILVTRQIIIADPWTACCSSCTAAYDTETWMNVFTDLCGWANNYLDLWTAQIYETRDQYCKPGGSHCIQLSIQYLCEEPSDNTGLVTYEGCMTYFEYAIDPDTGCGGPLYPGARIGTSDGCWIFQAAADLPIPDATVKTIEPSNTTRVRQHDWQFGDPNQLQ